MGPHSPLNTYREERKERIRFPQSANPFAAAAKLCSRLSHPPTHVGLLLKDRVLKCICTRLSSGREVSKYGRAAGDAVGIEGIVISIRPSVPKATKPHNGEWAAWLAKVRPS